MGVLIANPKRPAIIVPIVGQTLAAIRSQSEAIAACAHVDLVEWRADWFNGITGDPATLSGIIEEIRDVVRRPIIFTVRSIPQGGHVTLGGTKFAAAIAAVREVASYIDIEFDPGYDVVRPAAEDTSVIISYHDVKRRLDEAGMFEQLTRMASTKADVIKLATVAETDEDARALLNATSRFTEGHHVPTITIAMGLPGQVTRVFGHLYGSCATFASVGRSSAPGQMSLEDLLAALSRSAAASKRPS
jgi:3-dehydroquinate dehydratase-1